MSTHVRSSMYILVAALSQTSVTTFVTGILAFSMGVATQTSSPKR